MRTERREPILPARNLDETRAFYEQLGFVPWFRGRHKDFEIVSRRHLVVHFFAEPGLKPSENNASCYWRVRDADRFYQEFAAVKFPGLHGPPGKGIPRLTAPVDRPWECASSLWSNRPAIRPPGNLVRIGHDLDADGAYTPQDSKV